MGTEFPFGDIGPCQVIWGYGESGAVTLEPYLGTVKLSQSDTIHGVQEEAYGDADVDAVFGGSKMEMEMPLTRVTLAVLESVLLGELTGASLSISGQVGCSMYAGARALVIIPLCDNAPTSDTTKWIQLYKTYPYRAWELNFNRSAQRVFLVKWKIFMAQESPYAGKFGRFGINP